MAVFIIGFKADTQAEIALIFLFLLTQWLWGICAPQEASDSQKKAPWREAYKFIFIIWWLARLHEFITEKKEKKSFERVKKVAVALNELNLCLVY